MRSKSCVERAAPPSLPHTWASFALLLVSLVAVVGLAKVLSPVIETGVDSVGAPKAVIGVAIAALVLLPEAAAALRAALADRLQASMNLALGSALACIGLTVPAVAVLSVLLELPLVLGLDAKDRLHEVGVRAVRPRFQSGRRDRAVARGRRNPGQPVTEVTEIAVETCERRRRPSRDQFDTLRNCGEFAHPRRVAERAPHGEFVFGGGK